MKKPTGGLLLSLLCVTAIFTAGFATQSKADADQVLPSSLPIQGTVNQLEDGYLSVTQKGGSMAGQELNIYVSDKTKILDTVTGNPKGSDTLKKGDAIYAYVSPEMTLSLPPMVNGYVILTDIPSDYQVPVYVTVDKVTLNADGILGTFTADNGKSYTVNKDSQILPFLTKNIIKLPDLTKGQKCLIWAQADGSTANRIIAFADKAPVTGWAKEDGSWHYYDAHGNAHFGWLLIDGDWYYLNPDNGTMQTGFLTLDGKTYYLQGNGKMLTTTKSFTPDKNGVLH